MEPTRGRSQIPATRRRRVVYSLSSIILVMVLGVVGFHELEGMRWVDAVYLESMLAMGQGPPVSLTSDSGKIFASVMAFVFVGAVLASLVVNLGPVFSRVWREASNGSRWTRGSSSRMSRERKRRTSSLLPSSRAARGRPSPSTAACPSPSCPPPASGTTSRRASPPPRRCLGRG